MYLNDAERDAIYREARKRYGLNAASERDLNERLAEEYRNMENTGTVPKGATTTLGKIGQFFRDLLDFVRTVFTGKLKISNLDVDNLFRVMGKSNGNFGRLMYSKPVAESYAKLASDTPYTHYFRGKDLQFVKNTAQLRDVVNFLTYLMVSKSGVYQTKDLSSLKYMVPRDIIAARLEKFKQLLGEAETPELKEQLMGLVGLHQEVLDNYGGFVEAMRSKLEDIGIRLSLIHI